jgi:CBS domain containing-hemolysin-like protein
MFESLRTTVLVVQVFIITIVLFTNDHHIGGRSSQVLSAHVDGLNHSKQFSQQLNQLAGGAGGVRKGNHGDGNDEAGLSNHGLQRRHAAASMSQELNPDCEFQVSRKPAIYGIRCDDSEVTEDGSIIIKAFKPTRVYLIGRNLYSNLTVAITGQEGATQDDCTHADRIKSLRLYNLSLNIGEIVIELPPPEKSVPYYLCIREDTPESRWYHQGSEPWLRIHVQQDLMPLWAKIITIIVLLSMSGLFSGLNLGLMALDKNELQVIMKCGTEDEKHYATVIEPVRRRGNYLLCSILFSNTLVNSTISVFLEDLSDGLVAIMTSTILIVLFGEILPQAFCSRHGLAVGAKTIWLTHFCMFITFPLSYPVSYCLDWALGEEIGHAYDRERLMEFIQVTRDVNNLEADEVNIISGALKIKRVQISEVMTRIEDVYMLDETALLDFDTIQAIVSKGYSRIPVHEAGNRRNIKAVLFAKDLALVDPDDRTPVKTMISFYNHPRMFVFEDTTLDKALNEFKTGKSHMAIVQRVIDDGDRDPYYEVTGIVTLEDVIEEIMQMEINDETDTLTDNRRKRRRKDAQVRKDFSQFTDLGLGDSSFNVVTPQLCLAAYQYLATSVEPFTPKFLSDSVLRRLLSQKIFYKVRLEEKESAKRLYTAGEPADYFIMILEGRVSVRCGKENLVFEGGPFSHYGIAALQNCDQLGDSMAISASNTTTAAPVTPGGSTSIVAQALAAATGSLASATTRKDSVRPILSRRESLAKIVTSQLSLAPKKSTTTDQEQMAVSGDLSPTGSARINSAGGLMETVELVERGSYYFKPDYTVDIITTTSYLKVTRNDYITALRATWVEREGAAFVGEDIETTSC